MPIVDLPDEPTPAILDAISRALFAPLYGNHTDKKRERAIYQHLLRAVTPVGNGSPPVRARGKRAK